MKQLYTCFFKTFFLLVFLFPVFPAFTQVGDAEFEEDLEQSDPIKDSIRLAYKQNPLGIQLGLDLLKFGSFALDFETKYEGQVGLSYKNVTLVAEAGFANYSSELAYKNSDDYEVEGSYYRVGIDYALNIKPANQLLFGIRYGKSEFKDKGTFEVSSELWDNYVTSVERSGATATWGELLIGTQTNVISNFYFGWYFRLRKVFDRTKYEPIDIYNIPGYGKSIDQSVPALNFFIKYKFSF